MLVAVLLFLIVIALPLVEQIVVGSALAGLAKAILIFAGLITLLLVVMEFKPENGFYWFLGMLVVAPLALLAGAAMLDWISMPRSLRTINRRRRRSVISPERKQQLKAKHKAEMDEMRNSEPVNWRHF